MRGTIGEHFKRFGLPWSSIWGSWGGPWRPFWWSGNTLGRLWRAGGSKARLTQLGSPHFRRFWSPTGFRMAANIGTFNSIPEKQLLITRIQKKCGLLTRFEKQVLIFNSISEKVLTFISVPEKSADFYLGSRKNDDFYLGSRKTC